jgi:hypothetical protein
MPYLMRLAEPHWQEDPVLSGAINLAAGRILHPALSVLA